VTSLTKDEVDALEMRWMLRGNKGKKLSKKKDLLKEHAHDHKIIMDLYRRKEIMAAGIPIECADEEFRNIFHKV